MPTPLENKVCSLEWKGAIMTENEKATRDSIEALNDLIDCGGFRLGSKLDYNKCLRNARSILISQLEQREELQTVLSAWHDAFGTTQLTHALDRLQTAERKVENLEKQREATENEVRANIDKSIMQQTSNRDEIRKLDMLIYLNIIEGIAQALTKQFRIMMRKEEVATADDNHTKRIRND